MSCAPIPVSRARTKKPPTRINDTRFAIVIVNRSLKAANASMTGNSVSLITSINMVCRFRHVRVESWFTRAPASKKEKAPVANRSPLVAEEERRLLEGAGNAGERGLQIAAEALNNGDDRNRDAGSNQAVFDRRGARLVLHKTRKNGLHSWLLRSRSKFHVAV